MSENNIDNNDPKETTDFLEKIGSVNLFKDDNAKKAKKLTMEDIESMQKLDIAQMFRDISGESVVESGEPADPMNQMLKGMGSMIEQIIPGGMDGMQKMMDGFIENAIKMKKVENRMEEITEQVNEESPINGDSTINDLTSLLSKMGTAMNSDEQIQNSLKDITDSMKEVAEDAQVVIPSKEEE